MRRKLLSSFTILLFSAATNAQPSYTPDIEKIKSRGELIVSIHSRDIPPFISRANENLSGVDIELAKKLGAFLGVKVRFIQEAKSFAEVIDMVQLGKADIALSALYPDPLRAQQVLFSNPYYKIKRTLLVNRVYAAKQKRYGDDLSLFNSPATSIGFYSLAIFKERAQLLFPKAKLVGYDPKQDGSGAEIDSVVLDLVSGKINALYTDELDYQRMRKARAGLDVYARAIVEPTAEIPVAAAVNSSRTGLISWVNTCIDLFVREGYVASWMGGGK